MEVFEAGTEREIKYISSTPAAEPAPDTKILFEKVAANMTHAQEFHATLPGCTPTPLYDLGTMEGIGCRVFLKDEGQRMKMKAFKVLGGSYAVHRLEQEGKLRPGDTLTTMTDGNHGAGVAYAAAHGGYKAVIFVPECMTQDRRDRITGLGAELVVVDGNYDEAVERVKKEAGEKGWKLISDTAWPGYEQIPLYITSGYSTIFQECVEYMRAQHQLSPTHVLLQTGVGSLGAGGITYCVSHLHPTPHLICVEPHDADCMLENVRAAGDGTLSCRGTAQSIMAGLNCPTPASTAWPFYRDYCSAYVALGDGWARTAMRELYGREEKIVSGESGCAGYAALVAARHNHKLKTALKLTDRSVVLVINTEGATDAVHYNEVLGEDIA